MKLVYTSDAPSRGFLELIVGRTTVAQMHIKSVIRESDGLGELVVESFNTEHIEAAQALVSEALCTGVFDVEGTTIYPMCGGIRKDVRDMDFEGTAS